MKYALLSFSFCLFFISCQDKKITEEADDSQKDSLVTTPAGTESVMSSIEIENDSTRVHWEYHENELIERYDFINSKDSIQSQTVLFDSTGFIYLIKFNESLTPLLGEPDVYEAHWTEIRFNKNGTYEVIEVGRDR